MKRILITILTLIAILSHASAQDSRGQITFSQNSLKETGDSLHIDFAMYIESQAVSGCNSMRIIPELEAGDKNVQFPYILIQSKNARQMSDRWKKIGSKGNQAETPYMTVNTEHKRDTTLNYNTQVPYEQWMDSARLVIRQITTGCNNDTRLFSFSMNEKVELETRIPYQVKPLTVLTEPKPESKVRNRKGQAFLDFQVGRSVIIPNYRNNPQELSKIKSAIDEVKNNADVNITGIFIEGFASPEGKYETNARLSSERAEALKTYMTGNYGLNANLFRVNSIAEDWDGLKLALQDNQIDKKEEILAIIDNTANYDQREAKIKVLNAGRIFNKMKTDLFPQLRRVEYQIDYSVKEYSVAEVKNLIGKKDDQLSQLEMYRLAQSYGQDSKEFSEILTERITKRFDKDETANNNAAALLIGKGETALAQRHLDKAGENPAAWNNRGVLLLLAGELDKAESLFEKAKNAGIEEASKNLEEVKLKRDDNKRMERYKR